MTLIEELRQGARLPNHKVARSIRLAAGASQTRCAAYLGVHRVTFARWEAGTQSPQGAQRARYAVLIEQLRQEMAA